MTPRFVARSCSEEPLVAALPIGHPLLEHAGPLSIQTIVSYELILYPTKPRPSYADQVLSLLRERGLRPTHMREVRELQTALGLVAAGAGWSSVPDAVQRLRRDDIVYRSLDDQTVTSPIIMCSRVDDHSPEITAFLQLRSGLVSAIGTGHHLPRNERRGEPCIIARISSRRFMSFLEIGDHSNRSRKRISQCVVVNSPEKNGASVGKILVFRRSPPS